jgi:hypothetical protein
MFIATAHSVVSRLSNVRPTVFVSVADVGVLGVLPKKLDKLPPAKSNIVRRFATAMDIQLLWIQRFLKIVNNLLNLI